MNISFENKAALVTGAAETTAPLVGITLPIDGFVGSRRLVDHFLFFPALDGARTYSL